MAADPGAPSGVPVTGAQPQWGLVERCGRLTTLMVTAVLLPALWMVPGEVNGSCAWCNSATHCPS